MPEKCLKRWHQKGTGAIKGGRRILSLLVKGIDPKNWNRKKRNGNGRQRIACLSMWRPAVCKTPISAGYEDGIRRWLERNVFRLSVRHRNRGGHIKAKPEHQAPLAHSDGTPTRASYNRAANITRRVETMRW